MASDPADLRTAVFRWGVGLAGTLLALAIGRLYQTIDDQEKAIASLRERDVATIGEIAVIQARLNGLDGATLVRLDSTNSRLSSIEQRLDRVQHSLESLQTVIYRDPTK